MITGPCDNMPQTPLQLKASVTKSATAVRSSLLIFTQNLNRNSKSYVNRACGVVPISPQNSDSASRSRSFTRWDETEVSRYLFTCLLVGWGKKNSIFDKVICDSR